VRTTARNLKRVVDGKEPSTVVDDRERHALAGAKNLFPHDLSALRTNEATGDQRSHKPPALCKVQKRGTVKAM